MCSPFLHTDPGNCSEKFLRVDTSCIPLWIIEKLLLIHLVLIVWCSKFFLGKGGEQYFFLPSETEIVVILLFNVCCCCVALKVNRFHCIL